MTNVLYIIGNRPNGGVRTVMYNYQKYISKERIQIDYLFFSDEKDGDFDADIKKMGSKVYVLSKLKNLGVFSIKKDIERFFKKYGNEYDIVHFHSSQIVSLCYSAIKKNGIKHIIAHSHNTMYSEKKINSIRNAILCLPLKRQATVYMACSKAAGKFLYGKKAVRDNKVIVLNNAINCNEFCFNEDIRIQYRKELNLEDKYVIGNVGRFCVQKNHVFLFDIFAELKKKESNCVLMLVGTGELEKEIKQKADELQISKDILFLGMREDVPNLLQAMDIFVLPSLFEGLPVVGIEAQASGLPCVFADTITDELDIVNCKYLSIKEGTNIWVNEILHKKVFNREDTTEIIKKSGFDITIEAKKLEDLYSELK